MNHPNIEHISSASSFQLLKQEDNRVIHSRLKKFEKQDSSSTFSVKLVLRGTESYKLNDKKYDLSHGDFLIVDQNQELDISFNEQDVAEGMCFYFKRNYLDQMLSLSKHGATWGLDNYQLEEKQCDLLSGKFKVNESRFGQHLENTARSILNNNVSIISDDVFLDMANGLIQQQKFVFEEINQLSSFKLSTRKELYRRALIAKHYIEENLYDMIRIEDLAAVSMLSEVQLHRTFKQIFKITPYRYALTTKLNHAAKLIRNNKSSVSAVSALLGFSDLQTFSKAFKRHFGISPTLSR